MSRLFYEEWAYYNPHIRTNWDIYWPLGEVSEYEEFPAQKPYNIEQQTKDPAWRAKHPNPVAEIYAEFARTWAYIYIIHPQMLHHWGKQIDRVRKMFFEFQSKEWELREKLEPQEVDILYGLLWLLYGETENMC